MLTVKGGKYKEGDAIFCLIDDKFKFDQVFLKSIGEVKTDPSQYLMIKSLNHYFRSYRGLSCFIILDIISLDPDH